MATINEPTFIAGDDDAKDDPNSDNTQRPPGDWQVPPQFEPNEATTEDDEDDEEEDGDYAIPSELTHPRD